MNIWENTVLTDQGKALQAKLLQGQNLKITRVTTGSKKVPIVDLRQQTDVTEGGYDIPLQPSRTEGEKTILPVLLENTGLKESYNLWQVGFFAEDPDEGEILFCISQASQAKHIPSETESPGYSVTWNFYFNTSNTVSFEVVLNSSGLVNIEAYQEHTEAISEMNKKVDSLNSALINMGSEIYPLKNSYGYGIFELGYTTVGKIVCVSSTVVLAANIAAGAALCRGLPIPANYCAVLNIYDGQTGGFTHAKIVDGILYVGNAHNKGAALRVSGSYIAS